MIPESLEGSLLITRGPERADRLVRREDRVTQEEVAGATALDFAEDDGSASSFSILPDSHKVRLWLMCRKD